MKVLLFISSLKQGGAERVTARVAEYLASCGHEATLVTLHGEDNDFYELGRKDVCRICLSLAGVSHGADKLLSNWRRLRRLRKIAKDGQFAVAVGMTSVPAILIIIACFGLRTAVVAAERNNPERPGIGRVWKLLRNIVYRFADGHLAQTEDGAQWVHRNFASRNVWVIPNSVRWPVPGEKPTVLPDSKIARSSGVVLAVGSKVRQKGFDMLVKSFSVAIRNSPNWTLVLLGIESDTDGLAALKRSAKELGVNDNVVFVGKVGNISDWYERAQIFVLSSRYEGFPNALLEAMAGGCVPVAFDCETGPRTVIKHNVNGILVSNGDVSELAAVLEQLIHSPARRESLGNAARSVRVDYSEEKILPLWGQAITRFAAAKD